MFKGLTLALINSERKTLVKCQYERVESRYTRYSSSDSLLRSVTKYYHYETFNYSETLRSTLLTLTTRDNKFTFPLAIRFIRGRMFSIKSFYTTWKFVLYNLPHTHSIFSNRAQANTSTVLNIKRSNHGTVHGSLHHVSSLSHPRSYLRPDHGTANGSNSIRNGLSVKRPTLPRIRHASAAMHRLQCW